MSSHVQQLLNPDVLALLAKIENKYALVVAVAKRARVLKEGQLPMVDVASNNPVTVALEEIAAGKIRIDKSKETPKE